MSFSRNKPASKREAELGSRLIPVSGRAKKKTLGGRTRVFFSFWFRTVFVQIGRRKKKEVLELGGAVERIVHESVLTKQEQSEQQQHRGGGGGGGGEHPGPLQDGGCRGDSAHPGRGQARGQQLLLEGEVVHRQVVSQVWDGDGRKRRGRGRKRRGGEKRRMESIRTNSATKKPPKM